MDTTPTVSPAAAARPLTWVGLVVALLGPIAFMAQVQFGAFATPWYAPILGTLGALIVTVAFLRGRGLGAFVLATLLCGLAGFEWYVVGTSSLKPYEGPVAEKAFPPFQTTRADGSPFTDADLHGKTTALVFYRGNWCGICKAELRGLENAHDDFAKKGVQVVVVSPDAKDEAINSQKAFPHLTVVADTDLKLINTVGAVHKGGKFGEDTAAPTTILIDKNGTVRWTFRPDRFFTRLSPKELLAEVDRNSK